MTLTLLSFGSEAALTLSGAIENRCISRPETSSSTAAASSTVLRMQRAGFIVLVVTATLLSGCGGKSMTGVVTTPSAPKHASATGLVVACKHFGHYLSEYDYIEKGTSVRAYDILFHEYQRSCPKQASAEGEAWPERRKCNEPSESRFDCTAYHDTSIILWSAKELEENEE